MFESVRISKKSYFKDKEIFVFFQEWKFPYASMIHAHDFYELELVVEGSGEEIINGERFPKERGSVTISTPADYHSFEINEKMSVVDIMFTEQSMPGGFTNQLFSKSYKRSIKLSEEKICHLVDLCKLLKSVGEYENPLRDRLEKKLLESSILILLSQFEEDGQLKSPEKPDDIEVAMQYIDLHFVESPSINAVAEAIGKSPNYFSKFFKRSTGLHYSDYLNVRKVECAEMLLRFSNMSITDVCFNCGFNSLSNFLRVFKELKGMRPGDYRKKYRQ